MEFLLIALAAILVNNVVLTRFLGICSFLGTTKKSQSAIGMSLALAFVLIFSGIISYSLYFYVLLPLELEFLRLVAFILVIASLVQFVEMFIKRYIPALYKSLGIYLPLITTNCVVLTVALDVAAVSGGVANYDFLTMVVYVVASAIGFGLVTILFSFIQERLANTPNMPKAFQGAASALLVAGLMAIAFIGFKGMI
ncbi:MAG: electron transport complex protein RnfA [Bacilli bacterium]